MGPGASDLGAGAGAMPAPTSHPARDATGFVPTPAYETPEPNQQRPILLIRRRPYSRRYPVAPSRARPRRAWRGGRRRGIRGLGWSRSARQAGCRGYRTARYSAGCRVAGRAGGCRDRPTLHRTKTHAAPRLQTLRHAFALGADLVGQTGAVWVGQLVVGAHD